MKCQNILFGFTISLSVSLCLLNANVTNVVAVSSDENREEVNAHLDNENVVFGDERLGKIVAQAMGKTDKITYGDVRNYSGRKLNISAIPHTVSNLTSLKGLESLKELNHSEIEYLGLNVAKGVSLKPLSG